MYFDAGFNDSGQWLGKYCVYNIRGNFGIGKS